MTVLESTGGELVTVGGGLQPFPRSSVPLAQFGDGGGAGALSLVGDGLTVSYARLYRTQLWVAIAVNKLMRQVSRLPLKAYRRTPDGRERIRTGRLAELLERPFPMGGPTHLKQAIILPALVHGNAALRKARQTAGGPPVRLEPLAWSQMRVHGDEGAPVEMWETTQSGQPRYIDPADVVHVAWRGIDGPIGISPLQQLAVTIRIEDAAQRYQQALFANGARTPSAITADKEFLGLDRDERQELMRNLRADVTELYAGPENAGRPALLPPGLEWKPIGQTAVEAELIDQRKITREEVAACYDVSPPLIGLLERSTFNNITELHRMLYVTVLGPWLDLIEDSIKAQLIDFEPVFRGDVWVEFDLSEVLKGDTLQRAQALALQIGYGVLTIDEAREIENRPRFGLPETSRPLYPANNLKPVGLAAQVDQTAVEDVQQAARAIAAMGESDVRALLSASGGSVTDAIFELAGVSTNGHTSQPAGDDE